MAAETTVEAARWRVAGGSVRGLTHVHDGRPNQDAFAKWPADGAAHSSAIIAIADGHGGARHFRSDIGSRIAVDTTVAVLRESARELDAANDRERSRLAAVEIPMRIVAEWNGAARAHLDKSPITDDELRAAEAAEGAAASGAVREDPLLAYGATLVAVLATGRCLVFVQLGDGDILAVAPDGTTTRPVPVDERLGGSLTTSICRPGAESDFRVVAMPADSQSIALLLLSTDGYANSFKSDADYVQVGRDFLAMIEKDGIAAVEGQLTDILDHASANGSGDDISVALMHRAPGRARTAARDDASAAADGVRASGPAPARDVAGLEQRLESAEKRIGSMRRTVVGVALVAVVAIGWAMRDQLGIRLPSNANGGKPAISSPKESTTDPIKLPPGIDKLPGGIDKAPEPEKPGIAEKPGTAGKEPKGDDVVMGDPAHPLVAQLTATRADNGIEVVAELVFGRPDAAACAVEAFVWDGKDAQVATATSKIPKLRGNGPATVPVQVLVPYKDDKRSKAMKAKDIKASIAVSCDGKKIAESERTPVGG